MTEIEIDEMDLRHDVFRSAVPFDRSREETWPTVRVRHLPTGCVTSASRPTERLSREVALDMLRCYLIARGGGR